MADEAKTYTESEMDEMLVKFKAEQAKYEAAPDTAEYLEQQRERHEHRQMESVGSRSVRHNDWFDLDRIPMTDRTFDTKPTPLPNDYFEGRTEKTPEGHLLWMVDEYIDWNGIWFSSTGEVVPDGYFVGHKKNVCDLRDRDVTCVNPQHLKLVKRSKFSRSIEHFGGSK